MENLRKSTKNRVLFVLCTLMLAVICIAPFGLKPQNAYAACSHNWRDEKVMSQPTCTVNGSKMQYCTKCRSRRTVSISKLGHRTNGSYTITKYATCGTTGTRVLKCTRCYAVLNSQTIPATGNHNWRDSKVFQRPTCTTNGSIQQQCSGCGQTRMTYPSKFGHQTNGSYTVTKQATCTEKGRRVLKCTRSGCNDVLNAQDIPALGHTQGRKVIHAATATTDKMEIYYCGRENCNGIYSMKTITDEYSAIRKTIKNKNMSSEHADKTYKAIQQINSYYNTYKEGYSLSDSSAKNYFDKVLNNAEKQKNMKEILDTIDEYSTFFGLLNSDLVDECIDTCSYLKIGADLQAVINSPDNYARMNAVIDTLSDVCGKVPGADKIYCPTLDSLQKQWDKSSEKIQNHFSDLEDSHWMAQKEVDNSIKIEVNGESRSVFSLTQTELAVNCAKVEEALINHYNSYYLSENKKDFSENNIIMRKDRERFVKKAFGKILDEAGFFD